MVMAAAWAPRLVFHRSSRLILPVPCRSFGSTTNVMIKANELETNTQTYVDFMSLFTGKDKDTIRKDIGRNRWGRRARGGSEKRSVGVEAGRVGLGAC